MLNWNSLKYAIVDGKVLVNLTPHAITLVGVDGGEDLVIPASGLIARVAAKTVIYSNLGGIPLTRTEYGEVENLPEEEPDMYYIVSSLVASRCANRPDVFIPNESVRDDQGRIIGCKSLGHI